MAARFWVGGSGTWDNSSTTNWSATSGGAGGASAPTAADSVTFDANSGTAATVTVDATARALSTTINKSDINLSLSGSPILSASTAAVVLTTGTLTLNSYTLACDRFNASGSSARTIDFGTGNITVATNNATVFNIATTTSLTIAGTPVVNATYSGATGTRTISIGSLSENVIPNINVTAGTDIFTFSASSFVKNLNFTGFSGTWSNVAINMYGNLTISSGMTLTAGTNATTFAATSGTQQITTNGKTLDFPLIFNGVGGSWQLIDNLTTGSTRTVTLTNGALDLNSKTLSCGIFSSNNSNTRSIAFGTGNITLTGSGATIWSQSTATGFTYTGTPTVNCTYAGSTGTRTIITGGAAGGSATTALNFAFSAGTDTLGIAGSGHINNLDFTGFAGTLANGIRNIYGNLTISSGMSLDAGTLTTTFAATSGTKTITINGKTLDFPITFNGIGGTWEFADALTQGSTRAFTITNGTVKLKAGATSTVGAFATSGSNQKYLQSTTAGSQATLSQASGTVTVSYLSIKDIAATGGATWNAYVDYNNVDQGDNTGWDFSYSPAIDNEFPVALRSFTQPKRF